MSVPLASPIIRKLLIDNAIGSAHSSETDWPVFFRPWPDGKGSIDQALAVYDTSGIKQGRAMETGEVYQALAFQVKVRARTYDQGWAKCIEIVEFFEKLAPRVQVIVNSAEYMVHAVHSQGDILPWGPETGFSRRWIFSINYLATITAEA